MVKKILFTIILLVSILIPLQAFAQLNPQVYIDGEKVVFNNNPIIENGTTLVEFRPIFEMLGLTVNYIEEEGISKVIGTRGGLNIELTLGSQKALVNGQEKELPLAPRIVNGRTMVPLRFVGECSGREVIFDKTTYGIYLRYADEKVRTYIDYLKMYGNLLGDASVTLSEAVSEFSKGYNPSIKLQQLYNSVVLMNEKFNSVPVPDSFKNSSMLLNKSFDNLRTTILNCQIAVKKTSIGDYSGSVEVLEEAVKSIIDFRNNFQQTYNLALHEVYFYNDSIVKKDPESVQITYQEALALIKKLVPGSEYLLLTTKDIASGTIVNAERYYMFQVLDEYDCAGDFLYCIDKYSKTVYVFKPDGTFEELVKG